MAENDVLRVSTALNKFEEIGFEETKSGSY